MRINNFDFNKNYWKEFPEVLLYPSIKKLYDEDETEDKKHSSEIMWGLHLCLNPHSMVYNDPNKWERVKKGILRNEKINWDKYKQIILEYEEVVLTPAEKYFHQFGEILEKQRTYLKTFDYTKATDQQQKTVQTMIQNVYKVGQEYDKVKKLLTEDYNKSRKTKSFLEEDIM